MPINIGELLVPTLIDRLVEVVEGKFGPCDKYDLAVQILRYVHQQRTASEPPPENVIEGEVYRLWHSDEPGYYGVKTLCHLEKVTDAEGERLVIVSEPAPCKPKPESSPEPTPAQQARQPEPIEPAVKSVEPIIEPVVEPVEPVAESPEWWQARTTSVDQYYSKDAVAARVAKINADAADAKAQREREEAGREAAL